MSWRLLLVSIILLLINFLKKNHVKHVLLLVHWKNLWCSLSLIRNNVTAWKVSKYGVISGLCFPIFGLTTEIFGVNLRIQSEYKKIRTRNNSVFGHFSRSVWYTGGQCEKIIVIGSDYINTAKISPRLRLPLFKIFLHILRVKE